MVDKTFNETHPSLCKLENGYYKYIGSYTQSHGIPDKGIPWSKIPEDRVPIDNAGGCRMLGIEPEDIQKYTRDIEVIKRVLKSWIPYESKELLEALDIYE